MRWIFAICTGFVVLIGAVVAFSVRDEAIDVRVRQALIAGAVVASGWIITFFLQEYRFYRERQERRKDLQRALYAEIRACLDGQLKRDDLGKYGSEMIARMRDGADEGQPYIPFIPHETNDLVFKSVVADVHVLPIASIDPIVLYYAQIAAIDALIADLRSDGFKSLDVDRQIAIYRDYISMKQEAIRLGEEALQGMENVEKFGPKRAALMATG